jgi:replicative DNA helicase
MSGSDFNDLAAASGLAVVRAAVERAALQAPVPARDEMRGAADAPAAWPDPVLPGHHQVPEIPFDVLPQWLADMAKAVADSTQTPPALAVMVSLSVLATVLQRRFEVAPRGDSYRESLALWTLGTAASGARKTAVLGALQEPLVAWERSTRDRLRRELVSVSVARLAAKKRIEKLTTDAAKADDSGRREALRKEIEREELDMPDERHAPRLFCGDVTTERLQSLLAEQGERIGVLSDEPGLFLIMSGLYSGGAANLDVFLQGYSGSPMRIDRASREVRIDRPALSIGLMIQPGILVDVATNRRFRDAGLMARFLFAMPASNVGHRDVRQRAPVPPDVAACYSRNLCALLDGEPAPVRAARVLPMTEAAEELWLELAEDVELAMRVGGSMESIDDWAAKLPGQVARVAALLELAESGLSVEQVDIGATARAVRLGRLLIPHAQAAFALMGADEVDGDAGHVLKWVRAVGLSQFTRREAQKAMEGRFRKVERLVRALQYLVQANVVRETRVKGDGAGRPSVVYQVNPAICR